ncbi:MAG: hypothetical protein WC003_12965 [Terrimicrobiaceae bacterium]
MSEKEDIGSARNKVDEASEPLVVSIKQRLPELEELLKRVSDHWGFGSGFFTSGPAPADVPPHPDTRFEM